MANQLDLKHQEHNPSDVILIQNQTEEDAATEIKFNQRKSLESQTRMQKVKSQLEY